MGLSLQPSQVHDGQVTQTASANWRLSIPAGPAGQYRLAQIDDYQALPRSAFPWRPPVSLSLRARASAADLPGTWGFGLWNDPFALGLLVRGSARKLPALPQAAWFFYGSPPNYLSLRSDQPANGLLAATFSSWRVPILALSPAALALPLLLIRPLARLLRRAARLAVHGDARQVITDPTAWHTYRLDWLPGRASFSIDGTPLFATTTAPSPPLGFVLWIDNQYAAFHPDGRIRSGSLENPQAAWLEVEDLRLSA